MKSLVATVVCGLILSSDGLAPRCSEGEVRSWRTETQFEISLSSAHARRVINGEEDARPLEGFTMERTRGEVVVAVDVLAAPAIGRATRLGRSYETASSEDHLQGSLVPEERHTEYISKLEGHELDVALEDDVWTAALREADDVEHAEAIATGVRGHPDFAFLLPPPTEDGPADPAEGDRWTVDIEHLRDLVEPGGVAFPRLPRPDTERERPEREMRMNAPFGPTTHHAREMLADAQGTITVEHGGTDDEGRVRLVLAVEATATTDIGLLHARDVESGITRGFDFDYAHTLETHLEGEGELLWDATAGRAIALAWEARLTAEEHASIEASGTSPRTGEDVEALVETDSSWTGALRIAHGSP